MPLVKDKTKTHCRIGKVTYKHKSIVAFPSRTPQGKAQAMVNHARDIMKDLPQLDGYILIGFEDSGLSSVKIDCGSRKEMIDMPHYAEEIIRWSWRK